MKMRVIFLDIDGVLNNHKKMSNGYCGIDSNCVYYFNRILRVIPDAKIVISSAWRYLILKSSMTVKGFGELLLSHGVECYARVISHTVSDEEEPLRDKQIQLWIDNNKVNNFVILDDLGESDGFTWKLNRSKLVACDGETGITMKDVSKAIEILEN